MAYVIYAKGLAGKFKDFEEELLSDLARRGVNISNRRALDDGVAMSVQYTDEEGDMTMLPELTDIHISYTASGWPETIKGAVTGGATGGGLGVLTGVLTGKTDRDKIIAGVAGAISGTAVGAYRGYEKGMREKISFAKLLAITVTGAERKLETAEKQAMMLQNKNLIGKENLRREKIRLDAQLQQLQGSLNSCNTEEESKKTGAEARHIERSAQLELKYSEKKDLLEKLISSENKRYEAEIKLIESNYIKIRSNRISQINEAEEKIKNVEIKIEAI